MNRLTADERAKTLQLLCDGMSIRAITHVTGVSKNTIIKLLNDAGAALAAYQDKAFRDLQTKRVQVAEIWSFTYSKQKNVPSAVAAPEHAGDTWTWTAIDADSKLVMSWLVGGRDADYAYAFIEDVYDRLASRVQITSDGHGAYKNAIRDVFGIDVDHAQLIKLYGNAPDAFKGRYSPAEWTGIKETRIEGKPDMAHISMSYVERQNMRMRMHMRRFTRPTTGFSRKLENHANAVALHFAYYNFVRIHKTLRVTPAMAAGVTGRIWEMPDLVAVVEAAEEPPKKRGPYKVRSEISN